MGGPWTCRCRHCLRWSSREVGRNRTLLPSEYDKAIAVDIIDPPSSIEINSHNMAHKILRYLQQLTS